MLYADLSKFTQLSEKLDPEEVDRYMERIKQEATEEIEYYGGTVNLFIGDEVMALFGVPSAHEDDPARAVRAALGLHQRIRNVGAELNFESRLGFPLTLHSGIESGLIVTINRSGLHGKYHVTGDVLNVAARLRELSAADEIMIGPHCYASVTDFFETHSRDPMQIRGKAEPMQVHQVMGEKSILSRFDAAEIRGFSQFTGRANDLAQLMSKLKLATTGNSQFVSVEGEAGAGKSRLIHEFRLLVKQFDYAIVEGRCQSYSQTTPYHPFIDGLRFGLRLQNLNDPDDILNASLQNIRKIDPALEKHIPAYLHLMSLESDYILPESLQGKSLREALEQAIVDMVVANSRKQPVIMVFEDWHWSDEASVSALKYLLSTLNIHPVMVVVSYRSEFDLQWESKSNHSHINLRPLDADNTADIMRSVLKAHELPHGIVEYVHERTDGNPLFIEEACYALIGTGFLNVKEGRAILRRELSELPLPDSIQAIIASRMDRMDTNTREVIRLASAIGRQFSQQILAELYSSRTPLDRALSTLKQQELIQQTRLEPDAEYIFKHVLMREVAYETILHKMRLHLHAMIGDVFERLYPDRIAEHTALLAYHYMRSDNQPKAVKYALLAGDKAMGFYANNEALPFFEGALEIAVDMGDVIEGRQLYIEAVLRLAQVESNNKNRQQEQNHLQHALQLASEVSDDRSRSQILYWLGRVHYAEGKLHSAIDYAEQGLEIADQLEDESLAAPCVNLIGRGYWQLSDFATSARYTERSIEQLHNVGNKVEEATACGFAGALLCYVGDFKRGQEFVEQGIHLARELENPFVEAANFHYRGIIYDQLGCWKEAIEDYTIAKEIADISGDVFRKYLIEFMQGRALMFQDKMDEAQELIEKGVQTGRDLKTQFIFGQALAAQAMCSLAFGDASHGCTVSEEGIQAAITTGDRFSEALARRANCECLAALGKDFSIIEEQYRMVISIQKEIGVRPELARTYACFAKYLDRQGKSSESMHYYDEAETLFSALGMNWDLNNLRIPVSNSETTVLDV
ncbi:MAG: adenylate cyclase [marine bacterium B5-7]|nr:MAG: adenylate cyclase [marine bacterium B5-7]